MNPQPRPKVLMALYHLGERVNPYVARLEREGFEVVRNLVGRCLTEDELVGILPGVFATVAGIEPYTERVFQAGRDLESWPGTGSDTTRWTSRLRRATVWQSPWPFGTNHEAVADSTLTLMAAVVGNVVRHHQRVSRGGWGMDVHPVSGGPRWGSWGWGGSGRPSPDAAGDSRCASWRTTSSPDVVFARETASTRDAGHPASGGGHRHAPRPHTPETENLINRDRLA